MILRRTALLTALVLTLLPATAQGAGRSQIFADCEDDDILQGAYSLTDLRDAREHLTTNLREYSGCSTVLADAITAKNRQAGADGTRGGAGAGSPGVAGTTLGGGGAVQPGTLAGAGTDPGAPGTAAAPAAPAAAPAVAPPTPKEAAALEAARRDAQGLRASVTDLAVPGTGSRTLGAAGQSLPTALVVTLLVLAAAAVAGLVPFTLRRVPFRHRT